MSTHSAANLEFLEFLADISHPGTGQILAERLAAWLGLPEDELLERRARAGYEQWAQYANDILMILDHMQDRTQSLASTINWYRNLPISAESDATGDELVSSGRVRDAVRYISRVDKQPKAVVAEMTGGRAGRRGILSSSHDKHRKSSILQKTKSPDAGTR